MSELAGRGRSWSTPRLLTRHAPIRHQMEQNIKKFRNKCLCGTGWTSPRLQKNFLGSVLLMNINLVAYFLLLDVIISYFLVDGTAQICESIRRSKCTPSAHGWCHVGHLKACWLYYHALCFGDVIYNVMLGSIHLTRTLMRSCRASTVVASSTMSPVSWHTYRVYDSQCMHYLHRIWLT